MFTCSVLYAIYVMRMNTNKVVPEWQPLLCSMWSSVHVTPLIRNATAVEGAFQKYQ